MNVLLIDDQINVINGLMRGVDWEKLRINHVWAAYNSPEAKEIIQREEVNIMLCDIEMPGGDGLSLYRWVKEYDSRIECIFLTAHADFEFAKEALRLGSFDYILQPAPYDEVEDAVMKVCGRIRTKIELQRYSAYGKDFYKNRDLLLDGLLKEWLSGNETDLEVICKDIQKFNLDLSDNTRTLYCIMHIIRWENEKKKLEGGLFRYAFSNILSELFAEKEIKTLTVMLEKDQYALLFYQNSGDGIGREEIKKVLENFLSMCRAFYGSISACYLGNFCGMKEIKMNIDQVRQLQRDNVALREGVFVVKRSGVTEFQGLEGMKDWSLELTGGKADKVKDLAFRYLDQGLNASMLQQFYMKFMQVIVAACDRLSVSAEQIFGSKEVFEKTLYAYQSIDAMKQMVCTAADFFEHYMEEDEGNYVETVIQYIHCNIEKDIRRGELAQVVNLNEDYLSRIFKKEKGIALKEYIILEK